MTKEEIRSEIELRLYRGKPSDDIELDPRQIEFWMDKHRAALIKKDVDENFDVPQDILQRFDCQTTTLDKPVCIVDDCFSSYYIQLPVSVLDIKDDLGVFRVSLQAAGTTLARFHPGQVDIYKHTKYAKPTKATPTFYRLGERIYFVGASFKSKVITLDLVVGDTKNIADTDEYPLGTDLVQELVTLSVTEGLQQLTQGRYDINNDGKE